MKKLHPIILTNLIIFAVCVLLIVSDIFIKEGSLGAVGGLIFLLQAGINVLIGIIVAIFARDGTSKYYLLSAFVILLIGFSLCAVWFGTVNLNIH
jgi:hypothetical protein